MRLAAEQLATASGAKLDPRIEGAELADLGERQRREGLTGANVTRITPGSRAATNGLKTGDVIVAVNQVNIRNVKDLNQLIGRHPRQLLLTVVRGGNGFFLLL